MALKKSDLYSSLWASCDELRGGMDASQYKDYVLVFLFLKYVSDKYAGKPFAPLKIPAGATFADMVALKGSKDIGDRINKEIIAPLANANDQLSLTDFPDFNDPNKLGSGKEMVDRLTNLIGIFQNPGLDFSKNRADGDDILGDAYEYLMRHFATESGKSKGQFYTPAEVSRIMAKVLGIGQAETTASTTVYDPTCGSGSLLLKVADDARVRPTLYGQEKDGTTAGLARMNMILHDCPTATITPGNTLADPKFTVGDGSLASFDYVVANPPFSDKRWTTGLDAENDAFDRFKGFGVPPAKQGDYAYLLHIVRSLKSTGTGACILPHGVLFRGNAEAVIRRRLVEKGYLKGIIGLPANLFYGTGIPACILVLDKGRAHERDGIFMIDASKGFMKDGNKNRLRDRDIHLIVDAFTKQLLIHGYSRLVPRADIEKNDYNLNLPRYIDSRETEDEQDIDAHLKGGIPAADLASLAPYWDVCPTLREALFIESASPLPALPSGMEPAYAETMFLTEGDGAGEFPASFAIITACSTTGESWSSEENEAADCRLEAELRATGKWMRRATGYSPSSGHAEPGWAVDLAFDHACDLGSRYRQDAIYFVRDGRLFVTWCDQKRNLIEVDSFDSRVHRDHAGAKVRSGYALLRPASSEVKAAVVRHPEFSTFVSKLEHHFDAWRNLQAKDLRTFAAGDHPKELIHRISEDLLVHYQGQPLIDAYAVYQHLMDLWAEVMQDDAYLIAADGWKAETYRVIETNEKTGKSRDKGWTCDLVPKELVVARYFAKEQAALESLQAELESAQASLTELEEEHGGEDGAFAELEKINAGEVKKRLKEIKGDPEAKEEEKILKQWQKLSDQVSDLKKAVKDADAALDAAACAKYPKLTEDEVKTLVVDDKWLAALEARIHGEVDRVSQALTRRIGELADRYAAPLPELTARVGDFESKVAVHLAKMGFAV